MRNNHISYALYTKVVVAAKAIEPVLRPTLCAGVTCGRHDLHQNYCLLGNAET